MVNINEIYKLECDKHTQQTAGPVPSQQRLPETHVGRHQLPCDVHVGVAAAIAHDTCPVLCRQRGAGGKVGLHKQLPRACGMHAGSRLLWQILLHRRSGI
jgi:hypothetical protein